MYFFFRFPNKILYCNNIESLYLSKNFSHAFVIQKRWFLSILQQALIREDGIPHYRMLNYTVGECVKMERFVFIF